MEEFIAMMLVTRLDARNVKLMSSGKLDCCVIIVNNYCAIFYNSKFIIGLKKLDEYRIIPSHFSK